MSTRGKGTRGRGGGRGGKTRATSINNNSNADDAIVVDSEERENDAPPTTTSSSSGTSSSSNGSQAKKNEEITAVTTTASPPPSSNASSTPLTPTATPPKAKSKYRAKVVRRNSSLEASLASASASSSSQQPQQNPFSSSSSSSSVGLDYFSLYSLVSSAVRKPPNELRPALLMEPSNEEPPVELKPDDKALVDEMLEQLKLLKDVLGGVKPRRNVWELDEQGDPKIVRKLTRRELQDAYTDYEYIVLHIKGFVAIEQHKASVIKLNNHQFFTNNPGVKLLEKYSGITLHGDRPEANSIVESAFSVLMTAFKLAKAEGDFKKFFTTAFDRTADPCLEGRVGRLQLYIENSPYHWKKDGANGAEDIMMVKWRDFNLLFEERANEEKEACFGEFLRVFLNTTALKYAKSVGRPYEEIQSSRAKGLPLPDFYEKFCTIKLFRDYLEENGINASATTKGKSKTKKQKNDGDKAAESAQKTKTRCPFVFTPAEVNAFIENYSEFLVA
eukprot:TRINITY_DN980_c0_g1_i2.p1 TRINITY_DN980_c0_g1~~TRINITY_DN980_c0_g1_i2.p1  ORF type:complete len:502 (-),score=174.98 TRINITY_DN980_c0_g1_i2:218-1723(-)